MNIDKINKRLNIVMKILFIVVIAGYSFIITPKTFQNDTFYTIKIGELIDNSTEHYTDLLPWNKGLDMKDHFSYHNLPYTYPHWLYDFMTYKVYSIGGFRGIYILTCVFSVILGLLMYYTNVKLNKKHGISFLVTLASLYLLKGFIAARAQLVTFILFVLTILFIEQFLKKRKIRYVIPLVIIPILIANLHCAVWPFYFILYLPYIVEYLCIEIATTNFTAIFQRMGLVFKRIKLTKEQYKEKRAEIKEKAIEYKLKAESRFEKTFKIELVKEKGAKWLILIMIICGFTGLLTPIKDTPYTYLIKTTQGNTTQHITEHLPLTLIKNNEMIVILIVIFGILIFSKSKIKLRDFFMLMGLIYMSFLSRRQISMLVLIGGFIVTGMFCKVYERIVMFFNAEQNIADKEKSQYKTESNNNSNKDVNDKVEKIKRNNDNTKGSKEILEDRKVMFSILKSATAIAVIFSVGLIFILEHGNKKNVMYVNETMYPIEAVKYINESLIPEIGKENLRLYNDYNYGSYLLFSNIPVFIDSRADLYAPEFNGEKDKNTGKYIGRDIFSDFIGISNLSLDYDIKFDQYNITHVMTFSYARLNTLLAKDRKYKQIYEDASFVIYERVNENE